MRSYITWLIKCACIRTRRTPEGQRFGSTMVSVGAAATAYHAARGDLRCAFRKLDCAPPHITALLKSRIAWHKLHAQSSLHSRHAQTVCALSAE